MLELDWRNRVTRMSRMTGKIRSLLELLGLVTLVNLVMPLHVILLMLGGRLKFAKAKSPEVYRCRYGCNGESRLLYKQ